MSRFFSSRPTVLGEHRRYSATCGRAIIPLDASSRQKQITVSAAGNSDLGVT
jgi:hypothetical protein